MQLSDLEWVAQSSKIAHRIRSVGDLLCVPRDEPVVIRRAGDDVETEGARGTTVKTDDEALWVTVAEMTETVKEVDEGDLVIATVPREELRVVGYPLIAPGELIAQAAKQLDEADEPGTRGAPVSNDDLIRLLLAAGAPIRPL